MTAKRIGLDFDNTIISYDEVFLAAAKETGLIDADACQVSKQAVRDAIRRLPEGELKWQRLQGYVYGKGIGGAVMFAGVAEFLARCRAVGHAVLIVSHKTEFGHGDPDRVNLREKAVEWMAQNGIFDAEKCGVKRADVYFEGTRAAKLRRIEQLACSVFIDDLEEVLDDPAFPAGVDRVLFSPQLGGARNTGYTVFSTWDQIESYVFDQSS